MSARIPSGSRRPTILAGTTTSITGSPGSSLRAAEALQFFAIDLDLRASFRMPQARAFGAERPDNLVRVKSIWIPGSISGPMSSQRTAALWSLLEVSAQSLGLRSIVIPHSSEVTRGDWLGAESRRRLRETQHDFIRHVIGIRGSSINRGHDQLSQLQMIRHSAEEWDLDIALDLTGDVPHYLEAEAAIMRLLPRLTLVRIPSWVSSTGELNTNDPISRRVVSILADQGFSGTISIVPIRAPWQLPWTATAPTTSEEWTRTMIMDMYTRQRSDDLPAPYRSSELFREHY
jgi:hypothetical protein